MIDARTEGDGNTIRVGIIISKNIPGSKSQCLVLWPWVVGFSDPNVDVYFLFREKSNHERALIITIRW
jgi:hypothetical protein